MAPLLSLGVSALLNIGLDLLFVLEFYWCIAGAAWDTVLAWGLKTATILSCAFSPVISALVWVFAPNLMGMFIKAEETAVIASGVGYLRLEGAFYALIGYG